MSILLQVISRPNPKIQLGPVDSSVAIILCDLAMPDHPIVYVSDSFCELTGYSRRDVLGRNCRFLQNPPTGQDNRTVGAAAADKVTAYRLRQAVHAQEEVQLQVTNYRANGNPFTNILSIIPVQLGPGGYRYAVGFQVELE
jgi:PAS domain S-box-containing protein